MNEVVPIRGVAVPVRRSSPAADLAALADALVPVSYPAMHLEGY
jgi:hypothetical protein